MNYRILLFLNSFVLFLFGVAFLIVPTVAVDQFGVDHYASTRMLAQFFGTAMIALGLILWFAKDVADEGVQRGIGISTVRK